MLLCISTVKLFGVQQQRSFSSLAKRLSLTGKLPLEPQTQASLDKDFLPWLEQIAGSKITNTLTIGTSTYGRSLFASKVIHAGDCMLKVPFKARITPDELPLDIRVSLTDEVGNIGKLAAVLIREKKMGQKSRWVPYISRLPQPAEMHSTIFWGEDEFSMIRCSAVHKETVKQKAQIEKEFSIVAQAYKQHCPMVIKRPDLEDFMYAYALVGSRAWETSKGISLIPFADFMNHDGLSASIVISDEDKQLSEVTADRNYSPGDEVQIQMVVPNDDPLRIMKLGLLRTHHTRTVKDIDIFHSSCDTFTIKEVKSAIGKGKGIPQSLRAFARVLCCTIPQELNDLSKEAAQHDGRLARLPLKDRSRELEAHKILLSHINRLIEDHSACIKEMEESKCYFVSQRLVVRRQMARDLLSGELRVLRSAAEWPSHYCTTLFSEHSLYNSNIRMN
ncbi:PREDICTED: ribulose-1,5 bisphosphate carboxylase/oxygenase large subunit N-methyltransferase, chloroplastic-like isoform X2 [Camelina sativa]|uniref:Ribulose-1,5 bisphosphate carboxylase/oxygenase large subunit N-methyltransferase, chloroplastic-like isoform X2 n=1 Tax=Camelina sativa TaxID=90675 RepID=A0ABM0YQB4_CAMSA|nr:PREDICTED: ribulose-1,5 bisphosphate carboxylase/oxygenase large subunit N-methyltransferase, chloroplastic-like isoform X2 [Camelina sativa]